MGINVLSTGRYIKQTESEEKLGDAEYQYIENIIIHEKHCERLAKAWMHFFGNENHNISNLKLEIKTGINEKLKELLLNLNKNELKNPYRVRMLISKNFEIEVQIFPLDINSKISFYVPQSLENINEKFPVIWTVLINNKPFPLSDYTKYKTDNRIEYNKVREEFELNKKKNTEVLLCNNNEFIIEGTITNVAFFRNGKWVTPNVDHLGGLNGISRHFLLSNSKISVSDSPIHYSSIVSGELVLLFNAVHGVIVGRISL